MRLDGEMKLSVMLDGELSEDSTQDGELGLIHEVIKTDWYAGPMSVTPGAEKQTINTAGLTMPGNFVVEPIPNNYGLITYNGSTITVS